MEQSQSSASGTPEYVDDRDLARLTPICRAQWQTYRREGGGPPYSKLGRRCIYHWPTVKAWIDAKAVSK
jgi:hypothetical protein